MRLTGVMSFRARRSIVLAEGRVATTHARKPKQAVATHQRHRSLATETAYIPGYPTKLYIYLHGASQYWWVRYYFNGRVRSKTIKETKKLTCFPQPSFQ